MVLVSLAQMAARLRSTTVRFMVSCKTTWIALRAALATIVFKPEVFSSTRTLNQLTKTESQTGNTCLSSRKLAAW